MVYVTAEVSFIKTPANLKGKEWVLLLNVTVQLK